MTDLSAAAAAIGKFLPRKGRTFFALGVVSLLVALVPDRVAAGIPKLPLYRGIATILATLFLLLWIADVAVILWPEAMLWRAGRRYRTNRLRQALELPGDELLILAWAVDRKRQKFVGLAMEPTIRSVVQRKLLEDVGRAKVIVFRTYRVPNDLWAALHRWPTRKRVNKLAIQEKDRKRTFDYYDGLQRDESESSSYP